MLKRKNTKYSKLLEEKFKEKLILSLSFFSYHPRITIIFLSSQYGLIISRNRCRAENN